PAHRFLRLRLEFQPSVVAKPAQTPSRRSPPAHDEWRPRGIHVDNPQVELAVVVDPVGDVRVLPSVANGPRDSYPRSRDSPSRAANGATRGQDLTSPAPSLD